MTSNIFYHGELRNTLTHLASGQSFITDAPLDNRGKGQAFSPTDLLATSLGSCMLTIMGLNARTNEMNIDGTEAEITKIMAAYPRRVVEIVVKIKFPDRKYSNQEMKMLEIAALNCPVAKSLHPDIKQNVSFIWT